MSSAPMFPGLTPGANQSGTNIAMPYAPIGSSDAALGGTINPFLPSSIGTGGSMPTYPRSALSTSATSGFPANFGGYSTTTPGGGSSLVPNPVIGSTPGTVGNTGTATGFGFPTDPKGQQQLLNNLNQTYGHGMGTLLYNFLSSGAGFNQDAINNLIASLQPGFERNQEDLLSQFSAGGNRFSSGAQIGLGDLMSQEQLNVGQLETQMYEQALQNYMNILSGTSQTAAKRVSGSPGSGGLLQSLLQGSSGLFSSILGGL
jgi:hypothetical protein